MPRPELVRPSSQSDPKEVAPVEAEPEAIPLFIIACGGHSEAIYFEELVKGRDDIRVLALRPLTPQQSRDAHDLSSPLQTVERALKQLEVEDSDDVWIVLDVDHHFKKGHRTGTERALALCSQQAFSVVFSNPCFELWILLHTEEVLAPWKGCKEVVSHIRTKWKNTERRGYGKKDFDFDLLHPLIRDAIGRAKRLCGNSTQTPPANPGTDVHLLLEALDAACGDDKLF